MVSRIRILGGSPSCDHTTENALVTSAGKFADAIVGVSVGAGDGSKEDKEAEMIATDSDAPPYGTFTRLRLAGLL